MSDGIEGRTLRLESQRKLAALSLKRCPLCGAINALANLECFVCRWYGEFDRDPANVDTGLSQLLHNCPELLDAMSISTAKPTFWQRIKAFFIKSPVQRDPLLDL